MTIEDALADGKIRIVAKNKARARSLIKAAEESLEVIKEIPVHQKSSKTILRDLYECLRQTAEAKAFEHGYKSETHESLTEIIRDVLRKPKIALSFDKLRRLRNGINYYGDDVDIETVKHYLEEVPKMMKEINQ